MEGLGSLPARERSEYGLCTPIKTARLTFSALNFFQNPDPSFLYKPHLKEILVQKYCDQAPSKNLEKNVDQKITKTPENIGFIKAGFTELKLDILKMKTQSVIPHSNLYGAYKILWQLPGTKG